MLLLLNIVVAVATPDPFCAVVKQEYRDLSCCPQSEAPPVDATQASAAIAKMAASQGTCLGKGLAYEAFTASTQAIALYTAYDASPAFTGLQASLRVAEGKQVPKNFVNCPGMMIVVGYMSGWVEVDGYMIASPPPPCASGLVTALQVMQDIFGAETSLGINLVTTEGADLWVKVFTNLTAAVVTTPQHQYTQSWVNALFAKMQSINDLPDSLVGVLLATMFTHIQIVGGLQGITYTAPLTGKWAVYATNDQTAVSVNPVVASGNSAYTNLYEGSGGKAVYNALADLSQATCTMCER